TSGIEPSLGPLATAYVLILVVAGPLTARWTEPAVRGLVRRFGQPAPAASGEAPAEGAAVALTEGTAAAPADDTVVTPRDAAEDQDAFGRP
ncbi:cation:proton antiporter, partial [Streptomyces sp. NPDC002514]